ncbi:MAG: class I SAM-dependent methyltransferase [Deltaproteobacteria bacterium]|nr:class I SAM-dependent methyltransferase [Deltaproteobacteria bacterium]
MQHSHSYLMENDQEAFRLDIKTDPEAVREQALWCGIRPGLRILDVGCGPGKTTSILHEMVKPNGQVVGVDFSGDRIRKAKKRYGGESGIDFEICDFTKPMRGGLRNFDLIWIRFVLEYHAKESPNIIKNITDCLRPGGYLCLLDLDHNCLNHYELPPKMESILFQVVGMMEREYNFDPYIGRKLYSYLYDLDYKDIQMDLRAHHLIYGETNETDLFNWTKKLEMASTKASEVFEDYPGGHKKFFDDFVRFFNDPRQFTYTPLILCKGMKPV